MSSFLRSLVILCLAGVVLGQGGELFFSVSPGDHTVIEESPVRLRCETQSSKGVKYSWKLDGQSLAPSPRRHQIGSDLYITRVNRVLDSGNFVCVAYHEPSGNTIESSPAKINVLWISEASVVLETPKFSSLVRASGEVELRCHVDGSGEMRYEWFKNTKRLLINERVEIKKKKKLHIHNVQIDDNGVYTCLGKNDAGTSPIKDSFPLVVPTNETATIKVVPQSVIAKRGESISLNCVFENADTIEWYFKDSLISDDDEKEKIIFENGTLVIRNVEHRDQGTYACHGIRDNGNPQIYTAELQIAYLHNLSDASFEPVLDDQLAVVGQDQELQVSCLEPSGLPAPRVFWRDPRGHIISDSGQVRVQDNTLIIAKARIDEDPGNYTCVAENFSGNSEMTVQVIVSTPASLKSSPKSLTSMEGDGVSLTCSYSGMDPPVTYVQWLKDGELLKESGGPKRHFITNKNNNVTLHIKSAELSDKGAYSCEITTKGFPSLYSDSGILNIREKLKFLPAPVDKKLELNSTAKVSCKAHGATNPSVRWIKEREGEKFPDHVQDINGTLHFNGVVESDKGHYTCIASNLQGSINHTIRIEVVIAPKFIHLSQNPTEVVEGYPVMLHCAAEGDPTPQIQWDKNQQLGNLNKPRMIVMPNGTLYITEAYLTDEGKYGCIAGNSGGFKRAEVQLNVKPGDGYRSDMDVENYDGSMMTKTVTITLSVAAAYMVLVIGLMLYCRYRRRRRKQQYLQEQTEEKIENGEIHEEQTELKEMNNKSSGEKKDNRDSHRSDGAETAQSQSSNHSKKSKSSYDKIAVSRDNLKDLKPLGRGEFGEIFSTKYQIDGEKEQLVMVKSLLTTKDETALQEFKRHLDLLHKLNHENIAKLIGLCREIEPDYMIIEFTDWGDLKQFLIASKKDDNIIGVNKDDNIKRTPPQLSISQILLLSNQAAKGLKHLADNRLVHKDIAARNCLISSNLTLKISMLCMTKEPYQMEYTKYRNHVIPLRWLPYEAVYEDEYSTKSDIYSFSCLIWEMFNHGELPFIKLNDDSVLSNLKARTLNWKAHKAAPSGLQELQDKCWSNDPRERPIFDDVVTTLSEIIANSSM